MYCDFICKALIGVDLFRFLFTVVVTRLDRICFASLLLISFVLICSMAPFDSQRHKSSSSTVNTFRDMQLRCVTRPLPAQLMRSRTWAPTEPATDRFSSLLYSERCVPGCVTPSLQSLQTSGRHVPAQILNPLCQTKTKH